jgi:hypothetical protein
MFVFGVAVSNVETYETIALPGIRRAAGDDARILTRVGYDSIQRPYNEMMEEAAAIPGLQGLILIHQDAELTDDSLLPRVAPLLADPRNGLVGALGWAAPAPSWRPRLEGGPGRFTVPSLRILALQGNTSGREEDRFGWMDGHRSQGSHEVEVVDGVLLAIAPWVVRSVRFDERLSQDFHGYDADLSMRVRAAGGRVICNDIPHGHHMQRLWRDRDEFVRARVAVARRWDPIFRPPGWAPSFEC